MAGGLMQLVAYGAQDVYLTGNPEVTFFQAKYKRHTNFAMENIEQTVNGTAANSGRVSVTVARNGDLVGDMYVELESDTRLPLRRGDDLAGRRACDSQRRIIHGWSKRWTNTTRSGGVSTPSFTSTSPRRLTTVR